VNLGFSRPAETLYISEYTEKMNQHLHNLKHDLLVFQYISKCNHVKITKVYYSCVLSHEKLRNEIELYNS